MLRGRLLPIAEWLDAEWLGAEWLGAEWLGAEWLGAEWLGAVRLSAMRLGAAALIFGGVLACRPAPADPNILFILYDDLDIIGDLGPYGADAAEVRTPFSDLLAREGKRFERFYVNAPVCSPTRVSLLTGQNPARFGFSWASDELSHRGISASTPTLPRLLTARGYLTGTFGKWHIGNTSEEILPHGVGFARSAINCTFTNIWRPGASLGFDADPGADYRDALFCDGPGSPLEDSGRSFATTYTVDKTLELIAESLASEPGEPPSRNARPFYAQVWLHAPHTPLTCPPGGADCPSCDPTADCSRVEKRRIHHAMIDHAEAQLMRLRRDLEARGVWDRTLVIVASDNGGVGSWNQPSTALRGQKASLYERGIRTPLLIKAPGIPPGVIREPVASFDLLPTLAEHLNLPLERSEDASSESAGTSFAALLRGDHVSQAAQERALFWELRPDGQSTQHSLTGSWRRFAVRKTVDGKPFKLVQDDLWGGGVVPELYDLAADEAETENLTWQRPEVRHHLLDELIHWRRSTTLIRPRLASLEGSATMDAGTFRFRSEPSGAVMLEDQPQLSIGRFDFSISFSMALSELPPSPVWLIGREGSWSIRLEGGRLVLRIAGHRPQELASSVTLEAGKTFRIVATIENRRGLSLYIDDRAARARVRFGRVPDVESPIMLGRAGDGTEAFSGTISNLVFHSAALRVGDLDLSSVGVVDFESDSDRGFIDAFPEGSSQLSGDAAFRGQRGLIQRSLEADSKVFLPPFPVAGAMELQLSVWVRTDRVGTDRVGTDRVRTDRVKMDRAETSPKLSTRLVGMEVHCLDASDSSGLDSSDQQSKNQHPHATSSSPHLATPEWRRLVHRHLCPSTTKAVRIGLSAHRGPDAVVWDEIRLGRLGQARLDMSFEGQASAIPGFELASEAKSGRHALRLPAGAQTPMMLLDQEGHGGVSHFETSVWAKKVGAGKASLRLEFICLDAGGASIPLDVGNGPEGQVLSNPGRVGAEWQLYHLWASCPSGEDIEGGVEKVGIRLRSEGDAEILIDDLAVIVP